MTRRLERSLTLVIVIAALVMVLSLQTTEAKGNFFSMSQNFASSPACEWAVVPSPNAGASSGLVSVTAFGTNEAWAVGNSSTQFGVTNTLVERWGEGQWQLVSSPNPGSTYNSLSGVSGASPHDIWAVGYQVNTPGVTQTLIEHWNGSSWSVVPSPNPGPINNEFLSVVAISPANAWAVGFLSDSTSDKTLIEHWDGSSWSVVKSPNPGPGSNHLLGVAAISANDVWAVGNGYTPSGHTLIEHWNGSRWSVVKSPSPGSGGDLRAVAAVRPQDVWSVGYFAGAGTILPLIEHWEGANWQAVKSAYVPARPSFNGVAAASPQDVWTVGSYHDPNGDKLFDTLIEQWNGEKWSLVKSPSPGSFSTQLLGVAAVSPRNAWAVGYSDNTTLTERFICVAAA